MLKHLRKDINNLREKHQLINAYVEKYYNKSAEKDFFDFFLRVICNLVKGERSGIFITDMDNKAVWLEAGTGFERKGITVPLAADSMVGRVVSSGKAKINNNMMDQEGFHKEVDSSSGLETRNGICVPVKSLDGNRITGAIQVLNKENGEVFTEDDQKWLEDIAGNIQLNIEHAYLQQETLSLADKLYDAFSKLLTILVLITFLSMLGMIVVSVILTGLISI